MELKPEEAIKEIYESAKQDTEYSRELGAKFFFHWALLSGAALTLFTSFLTNDTVQIHLNLTSVLYAKVTILFFFVSLFISSIRNFVLTNAILSQANYKHKMVDALNQARKFGVDYEVPNGKKDREWLRVSMGYVVIACFLLGTMFAYLFVSETLFAI